MRRNTSALRLSLTLLLLAGLFFGAVGQSLARGEVAIPFFTLTASVVKENVLVRGTPAVVAAAIDDYDLSLTMTVPSSDTFPNIGETVTFTIIVMNNGEIPVTGITVKDIIPSELTYKSDDSGGTYNKKKGIWVVGSLNAAGTVNDTAQLKIIATVMQQTDPITNVAEIWFVDSGQPDPDSTPGNGVTSEDDYAKVTINPKVADLRITKTVDNPTPSASEIIQYTITVSNEGNSNAENVTVKDLLPAGLTYVSDSDDGTTYNSSTGIWAVGTLLASGAGSSDTLIISAKVTTAGAKKNVAEVWTSDQYDPDSTPGNGVTSEDDYASVVVTPPSADLNLIKKINNPSPNAGAPVIFTIQVSNAGPNDATNVSVKDLLPSDFTYVSDDSGGNYDKDTGIWTVGNITNSTSAILNIHATTVIDGATTNWAEIWTSDQPDPDSTPGDGSRTSDDDAGAPTADLSIIKSVNLSTVTVGSNVVFTITVSNAGPGKASNVSVKDVLPAGLKFVSDTGAGAYNRVTGMWTIGSLSNGADTTLRITAKTVESGTMTNWAEVWTTNQLDPDSTPRDGSITTDDDASVAVTARAPTPTPTDLKTVVISEVGWMGTSSSTSGDEWIELFNTTNKPIDMTGWHLRSFQYRGEDFVLNLDIVLTGTISVRTSNEPRDPSGFYLLETRENAVIYDSPALEPDGQIYSGSLYNSGEILLLCATLSNCNINTKRQTVDFVNATLSTSGSIMPWAAGSSSTYGSMERKELARDEPTSYFTHVGEFPRWGTDANGNAIKGTPGHPNWAFDVTSTPRATVTVTRTPTRSPLTAPFVVINEVLARSGSDWNNDGRVDVYDEFIEVINSGTVDVNLSGYKLDDYELDASGKLLLNAFTLPSQILKPGEKAVFYGSQTGIHLEDAGDTVFLMRTSNNSVVDKVTYPIVKALDFSVCRYTDGYGSWIVGCFPTPGLPNMLTGNRFPSTSNGQPVPVCVLPDSVPDEFAIAECEEGGLGIWNYSYWDSFPGEGDQIWQSDERDKWLVIYQ